jgi:hypothetical protein
MRTRTHSRRPSIIRNNWWKPNWYTICLFSQVIKTSLLRVKKSHSLIVKKKHEPSQVATCLLTWRRSRYTISYFSMFMQA